MNVEQNVQAWQQLTEIVNEWVNPKSFLSGYCYIEDANDGSGDGILTFPEGMCEKVGWKEGDTLNLEVIDGNKLVITKKQQ